jgi:predicted dehydrogenase
MAFRVGIIGLVHLHLWWYLDAIKRIPDAEIPCASDPNPELLEKVRSILDIGQKGLYRDYREMLDKERLDACLVFVENNRHAELVEACARRGLHVMVEKPIASNLKEADRMLAAANRHNVRLMVNYPIFHMGFPQACLDLIRSERIGRPWLMRFATGHSGPENFCPPYFLDWLLDKVKNGGGALQDFGTYGAALFAWYFGRPDRVSAAAGKFVKARYQAEDHAVITVTYEKAGVLGTIEGTWCSIPDLMVFNIFGEKGAVFNSIAEPNRFQVRYAEAKEIQPLALPETGKWEDRVLAYFIGRVREGKPFEGMVDPVVARNAQEILDAAKRAVAGRRVITLPKD